MKFVDRQFVTDLPLSCIEVWALNPRRSASEEKLAELVESIRANGVQQPIVVRAFEDGTCHPIMGARRVEASRRAGLVTIPAIVRVGMSDQDALMLAVVENTNRENLNAIDEALGWKALLSAGWTQSEIVAHIGCSQPNIANGLRLLRLPEGVQDLVRAGSLSATSARSLLQYEGDDPLIRDLAQVVMTERIPSRALEGAFWPEPLKAVLARHGVHRADPKPVEVVAQPGPNYRTFTRTELEAEQTMLANVLYTLRKGNRDSFCQANIERHELSLKAVGAEWVRRGELPGMGKEAEGDKSTAQETGEARAESISTGGAHGTAKILGDEPGGVRIDGAVSAGGGDTRSEQAVSGISASAVSPAADKLDRMRALAAEIGEEEGVVDVENRSESVRSVPESATANSFVGAAETVGHGLEHGGVSKEEQASVVEALASVSTSSSQATVPSSAPEKVAVSAPAPVGTSTPGTATPVTPPAAGSVVMAMVPRDEYDWMVSEGLTVATALALLRASGEASAAELPAEKPGALDVNMVALVSENEEFRAANVRLNEQVETLRGEIARVSNLPPGYHAGLNVFVLGETARAALSLVTSKANARGPVRDEFDQLEVMVISRAKLIEDEEFDKGGA